MSEFPKVGGKVPFRQAKGWSPSYARFLDDVIWWTDLHWLQDAKLSFPCLPGCKHCPGLKKRCGYVPAQVHKPHEKEPGKYASFTTVVEVTGPNSWLEREHLRGAVYEVVVPKAEAGKIAPAKFALWEEPGSVSMPEEQRAAIQNLYEDLGEDRLHRSRRLPCGRTVSEELGELPASFPVREIMDRIFRCPAVWSPTFLGSGTPLTDQPSQTIKLHKPEAEAS